MNVIVHFGSVGRLGASCVFFCLALYKAIKGCLFSEPSFFFSRTTTPYTNLPSTALYCSPGRCELPQAAVPHTARVLLDTITCSPRSALKALLVNKGYGLKCPGWWECSLAAISQTTTHMHGHHEATMGLAGVSLGRELRALALSHTASVRRGTA